MLEKIENLKAELAAARAAAQPLNEELEKTTGFLTQKIEDLRNQWLKDFADLIQQTDSANQSRNEAEQNLRTALIEYYETTGEKTYDKELSVRETTHFEYEMADAVRWALDNAPVLLTSVNKKLFEVMAEALNINFVSKIPNVSAVIAKKLTVKTDQSKEVTA
ncbi:MAG: hypothetical protein KF855_03615 [Acidobacteria bacterium]|nr:hypothetical protein [Acidobacteriota bacterium]